MIIRLPFIISLGSDRTQFFRERFDVVDVHVAILLDFKPLKIKKAKQKKAPD
tara:strand:+ start:1330 stop:1485 length:156 start_codon:yes stop_codon:yes gene_type:complete